VPAEPTCILITGVNGLIGNILYRCLASQPELYQVFGLDRLAEPSKRLPKADFTPLPAECFSQIDLGDFAAVLKACQGMDCVVHLAADPDGYNWESVRDNNMIATYHIFEACRQAGVKRVVYASSVMVNFGYPADELYGAILHNDLPNPPSIPTGPIPLIQHTEPPRPSGLYAASKIWGEALAYSFSYQYKMHCLCVRIGWVVGEDQPRPRFSGSVWLSHRDCAQFFQKCIEATKTIPYDIFFAVSDNRYRFLDLEHAHQVLGYIPQDGDIH
jgi:nucleoside-diphosphate-sugar epimerase